MTAPEQGDNRAMEELLDAGADIAGGIARGAIGFYAGGVTGVVVGGASGPMLTRSLRHLAYEVKHRLLGAREEARIGATLLFATRKIRENLAAGQQVRRDGFFGEQPGERTAAEEVFEGVLLTAQREPQEKKLRFYGNLVANIAFRPDIDREQANLLVRLGQDLSYRQLCVLALSVSRDSSGLPLRGSAHTGGPKPLDMIAWALDHEIYNLYQRTMIFYKEGRSTSSSLPDLTPPNISVQGLGLILHDLMELQHADPTDLSRLAALLNRQ